MRSTLVIVGLCVFLVGCAEEGGGGEKESEKDPWSLRLPLAASGTPLEDDADRIVMDILDLHSESNAELVKQGVLDVQKPPIMMEGRQVSSLKEMREVLYEKANPRLFPDLEQPEISPGLRASRKTLLIRCDQGQIFGWIQVVMQCCTFLPGKDYREERKVSPLLWKIELATEGGKKLISHLPSDAQVSGFRRMNPATLKIEDAEVIMKIPRDQWGEKPERRAVTLLRSGSATPLGKIQGVEGSEGSAQTSPKGELGDALIKVKAYLDEVRAKSSESSAKISAGSRTPYLHVVTVLSMVREAGFTKIVYSGIPPQLVRELERGAVR